MDDSKKIELQVQLQTLLLHLNMYEIGKLIENMTEEELAKVIEYLKQYGTKG